MFALKIIFLSVIGNVKISKKFTNPMNAGHISGFRSGNFHEIKRIPVVFEK